MNTARIAILGIALVAGGAAAYLASSSPPPPPPPQAVAPPPIPTTEVLVAARDLGLGAVLRGPEMRWQSWPPTAVSPFMIKREDVPGAMEEFNGSIARMAMLEGEPIRREKLIKQDGSGFMSAILPEGKRALAIAIDQRGTSTAGGFILPNDRVDIIRTYRDEAGSKAAGGESFNTETLLQSVRVLAIGQNIQERNGERVVVGETATLELDAQQVELIALAQRTGQLSLALRSMVDRNAPAGEIAKRSDGLTIIRFGIPTTQQIR